MNVLAWILGLILVVVFGTVGLAKLFDLDRLRDHLGYSATQYRLIGLWEIVSAAGVIIGLTYRRWEWLGPTGAVMLMSLLFGAMMAHARVEDPAKKVIPAVVLFVVALVFAVVISLR